MCYVTPKALEKGEAGKKQERLQENKEDRRTYVNKERKDEIGKEE
jgi:hypothetical protein